MMMAEGTMGCVIALQCVLHVDCYCYAWSVTDLVLPRAILAWSLSLVIMTQVRAC